MSIYLDYNASAPLYPSMKAPLLEAFELCGNPSSVHTYGRQNKALLDGSRQKCADFFGVRLDRVVFTSGATESINQVIKTFKNKDAIIFASTLEHEAVRIPLTGYEGTRQIGGTPCGILDLKMLEKELEAAAPLARPMLVCSMYVNNETGIIQPIEEVVALAKRYDAYVLCDAVQAMGRIAVDFKALRADYLVFSAHKMGGLKGIGATVLASDAPLDLFVQGGGQERGKRSGTENVLGIISLGLALEKIDESLKAQQTYALWRDHLESTLQQHLPTLVVVGQSSPRVSNVSCLVLEGVKGETQVMRMDLEGFALSMGSACSSGKLKTSYVLSNMGYDASQASCSLRMSFGHQTQQSDLEQFAQTYSRVMKKILENGEKQ